MSQQMLTEGQEFAGRYRIERFLAEGGFGAVYVAEQLATEAQVALKVLWPHVLGSRDAVEKFEQEARIAGRVNSEHIVRVVDAGFEEATQMPFLVMELLTGEDLNRLVERQGPVSPDLVVEYLRQVASALDRAHGYVDRAGTRRPIVHRDLKPENLFLSRRENGDPLVKVLDFGIAKITSSTANVSREIKGTPLYMAYEQAAGQAITPQTDVWAIGLIAFYLLTGMSYWRSANSEEASLAQLFGEVLSLPLTAPSERLVELGRPGLLPPAFDGWFGRCVNRDAAQRYPTAGEAIAMLADIYGIVLQSAGSRPGSAVAFGMTPVSNPNPATMTPVHASPPAIVAPQGPTLQSVRAPEVHGGTQGALAISGTVPGVPKKSSAGLVIGIAAALALIVGIVVIVAVAKSGGAAAAASATPTPDTATAASAAEPTPTAATVAPTTGAADDAAAPTPSVASTTPTPVKPTGKAEPKASAEPKTTASATTAAAPPTPPPTTPTKRPKEPNAYDDR